MKKILLSFSFLLLLVACQSSSAINLSIKEESLTPDGLTLIIKNNSDIILQRLIQFNYPLKYCV